MDFRTLIGWVVAYLMGSHAVGAVVAVALVALAPSVLQQLTKLLIAYRRWVTEAPTTPLRAKVVA
jgi:hypothetical protein